MRILLRSDAGVQTGTGHVMRCLALAEELIARGHEASLQGTVDIPWLAERVAAVGVEHLPAEKDLLDAASVASGAWDVVVVDSYDIDAEDVSELARSVPVVAIIDSDDRGIDAALYLDQNLGAEQLPRRQHVQERLLAGSRYALVRRSIAGLRRDDRWRLGEQPRILSFFGGSDPLGATPRIARSLAALGDRVSATLVVTPEWRAETEAALSGHPARLIAPTPELAEELARADIVISAAGTSAWDIGTMAIPAIFAAVVGNQRAGLEAIVASGTALGIDASDDLGRLEHVGPLIEQLLGDHGLRRSLVERCLATYDGRGVARVADALEGLAAGGSAPW